MLRQGSGQPLVLLHGVLCSKEVWKHVVPLLTPHYEVIVPTALGHRGGPAPTLRPAGIEHIIDDAERVLDELGLETAHLAGNSMGGWAALELARRGRARTVCALSPAGAWELNGEDMHRVIEILRVALRDTRRARWILPLLTRSKRFRHFALRHSAVHGDRVTRDELLSFADDAIGCEISEDLLSSSAHLPSLDPAPCPITLAWSGQDRLFPVDSYGARARELVPGARFIVLDDVGHVPMFDDPRLVARTIVEAASAVPAGPQG